MDIGSSVAVFLVLALVLLALFCFLTKYFHHKLKQKLQQTAEIYSMVDELSTHSEGDPIDHKDFDKDNDELISTPKAKKKKDEEVLIEMSELKKPLNQKGSIYGDGILKQKLNEDYKPSKQQQTNRSAVSLKSFRPDKINQSNRDNRTGRSLEGQPQTLRSNDDIPLLKSDRTKHNFINKLVCYDSQGITVIEVKVVSIRKLGEGSIKQTKKAKTEVIPQTDIEFQDQLQIHGFQKHSYGCYKYETAVQVQNMKLNEDYMIKSLKCSEVKQSIEEEEYVRFKLEIENS